MKKNSPSTIKFNHHNEVLEKAKENFFEKLESDEKAEGDQLTEKQQASNAQMSKRLERWADRTWPADHVLARSREQQAAGVIR